MTRKLGAFGADLAALSHFFNVDGGRGWQKPAARLTDHDKAVVLSWAAYRLRALGRLQEATQPMQAAIDLSIEQEDWKGAAFDTSNLSELQLADDSGDAFWRMASRTTLADAQHQAGDLSASRALFAEVEALQQEWKPDNPKLYSLRGFQYCDLLLTAGEWREVQQRAKRALEISKKNWFN